MPKKESAKDKAANKASAAAEAAGVFQCTREAHTLRCAQGVEGLLSVSVYHSTLVSGTEAEGV